MKKLCKSNTNKKICGVCGGIAEYLNADPTLIRLAFVLICALGIYCLLLLFDDQAYLIDGGWEQTYGTLHEALQRYGITRLNGVFLTHCDRDHYGGLLRLASDDIPVDAWYAASIYHDIPSSGHPLVDAAATRSESVRWLNAGDVLELGSTGTLTVLGPLTKNIENENNNSLVFSVETADGFLLFTGDMKLEEEAELLTAGLISGADVLKVPFHGDNTASSESFVQAVMPQIALICTSTREEPDTPAGSREPTSTELTRSASRSVRYSCGRPLRYSTSRSYSARRRRWGSPVPRRISRSGAGTDSASATSGARDAARAR